VALKSVTQHSFQGYVNDGAINTGTPIAAEDANFAIDADTIFHLRIGAVETNNKVDSSGYDLYVNYNGGGYVLIGASSVIQYANGAHTDGGATTQRLGSAGGAWVNGEYSEDGTVATKTLKAQETEFQFALMFDSAQAVDQETCLFQLYRTGGTQIESYTITPTITVNVAVAPKNGAATLTGHANILAAPEATKSAVAALVGHANILAAPEATKSAAGSILASSFITVSGNLCGAVGFNNV